MSMISTTYTHTPCDTRKRLRLTLRGVIQGVGFRPFAYRLAKQLSVAGWIMNTSKGVLLEIEGTELALDTYQEYLRTQGPPAAKIQEINILRIPESGVHEFLIYPNQPEGARQSMIAPDLSTCDDCVLEIQDPHSRRFRYPFTTCAQCGPRYSVITDLPYDRSNTTMTAFPLCHDCLIEYEDVRDRRFHAEAITCPNCGPQISVTNQNGIVLSHQEDALKDACAAIQRGKILALKGLGGFQLWVNTLSEDSVRELRLRKNRPRKPFAVLFPSLTQLRDHCVVSPQEETLLRSPAAPIVLLRKKHSQIFAPSVAPDNPYLGAMLPYTPLHHLMMEELGHPVVATSGNLSEEPIIIDAQDALRRLNGIADVYLTHNRPIARPIDDSVVRLTDNEQTMLRRARGYVPVPLTLQKSGAEDKPLSSVLALGGHLKSAVAVTTQDQVVISQHIGDLSTVETDSQFKQTIADQIYLYNVTPKAIACDLHPDYPSSLHAKALSKQWHIPIFSIQHHHAHIASCMAEHGLEGPVLGVAWDGAGYGSDGTLWGGEFLSCDYSGFTRIAHLIPFRLPGGEVCMREPRRVALSLLYEIFGKDVVHLDLPLLHSLGLDLANSLMTLMDKNVNCPTTTSMGRLFDAISSILGLRHFSTFEGEAAMALEFTMEHTVVNSPPHTYEPILLPEKDTTTHSWVIDWRPFVKAIVEGYLQGTSKAQLAEDFHHYLVDVIERIAQKFPHHVIVLSGGVFQNARLITLATDRLQASGNTVYTNVRYPNNDGGLSLGQAIIAQTQLQGHHASA